MGQGQSNTRRITVINDEAAGVIKISDSVVQRLKDEMNQTSSVSSEAPTSDTKSGSAQPQQPYSEPAQKPPQEPLPPPPPAQPAQVAPAPAQQPLTESYCDPGSLTALKVRAAKEEELRMAESYWQERVKKLRDSQLRREELSEDAYRESAEAVNRMFLHSPNRPVCPGLRNSLLQCYQQNKGRSLLCAEQVNAFEECVQHARMASLGRSG